MQHRSFDLSKATLDTSAPSEHENKPNYGFRRDDGLADGRGGRGDGGGSEPGTSGSAASAATGASAKEEDGDGDGEGEGEELRKRNDELGDERLSLEDDGKIENEDALSESPNAKAKSTKAVLASSPIVNMPNEILTHALSHLTPNDLSSAALVSKRFHALITTPHAWRTAFARFFPGPASIITATKEKKGDTAILERGESFRSDRRVFCRLTALSTWRSEYILRTRLLRSLTRGKPAPTGSAAAPRGFSGSGSSVMMYNSQLLTTVTKLHASFGSGLTRNHPRFIHGADEFGQVSLSDPTTGKVDNWGLADPQRFLQFSEIHGSVAMYGLGAGEVVGCRNSMDVSQPYGMIYGEGLPSGSAYHRSLDEGRGRFLLAPLGLSEPEVGIPRIDRDLEAISAVWITKNAAIPSLTEGLIGMITGSSLGVVSTYSLGSQELRHLRLTRGELTARWVLSPGVPIIAIAVDDSHSLKRQAQNRIWAVALNALGELFFLTKFPKRQPLPRGTKLDASATERMAWATGRSVYWNLVEMSRREARPDPFDETGSEGSYSPRSSWNGMCLSPEQIRAESREIEEYLRKLPKHFRQLCKGWDMCRRLEVDFDGDDGNFAGESLVVFECGLQEDDVAAVKRYSRLKVPDDEGTVATESEVLTPAGDEDRTPIVERDSLFGAAEFHSPLTAAAVVRPSLADRGRVLSVMSHSSGDASPDRTVLTVEEWRVSTFSFGGVKDIQISTTAIDCSTYATLTLSEDPAVGIVASEASSSQLGSPLRGEDRPITPSDVPGQRARFMAAGTKSGNVYLWNIRAASTNSADLVNTIDPLRIIYTDSPEISCLGLTAAQVVVGGNDGLVQAWDPLASSLDPIRTLNSRFSSRARRRLAQAQASPAGVGINLYAAGAICLDPDPTVLRGMVSLGTHLRYWSYASLHADQYKGTKRRLRRSERGSNQHGGETINVRSSNLKTYIANERAELELEVNTRRRESERLNSRFGLGMLEDEEQALAYAALLSEESLAHDEARRASQFGSPALGSAPAGFATPALAADVEVDEMDAELAEALRRSLQDAAASSDAPGSPHAVDLAWSPASYSPPAGGYDIPIRVARKNRRNSPPKVGMGSASTSTSTSFKGPSMGPPVGDADVEFALQLSLAEEESRKVPVAAKQAEGEVEGEDFPALPGSASAGKGKGRA